MARIVFYEKPGCSGNAKQKAWLEAGGHVLEVRSLLEWPWTREVLLEWLRALPVAEWFNRSAPAVRDGLICPEAVQSGEAIDLLLATPLLIRRPLIALEDGTRLVGFNEALLRRHLLQVANVAAPSEGCASKTKKPCPDPRGA